MKKILLVLFLALFNALPSHGMYLQPELQNIPLDRLLKNLAKNLQADPTNSELLHQLARTHAMAYSSKIGDADPVKIWSGWDGKKTAQLWFGPQPPQVPFATAVQSNDTEKVASAKAHLAKAIEIYQKALASNPKNQTMKLGLAWCQDQAGQKAAATILYREVADSSWATESKSQGGLGDFVYVESTGYLLPLLNPSKNADEIALIKQRKEHLLALPRAITPLVIPVGNHDNLSALLDPNARVHFDLDGSGRQLAWPWITNEAAWLVFDPQHSGKITSAIQMFGSRSFLLFCSDAYAALALLDDNHDGILSGEEITALALWRDRNANGISDLGEVLPLSSYGITSLSTRRQTHETGISYCPNGATYKDGSTRPTYDLILESKPQSPY